MRLIRSGDRHFATLTGVASVIDLFGIEGITTYHRFLSKAYTRDAKQTDYKAIKSDWVKVGNDLTKATEKAKQLYGS